MNAVTLSSKYQVVIPQAVRERLKLQPGQQFQVVVLDGRVELIPVEPAQALRGFMKGVSAELGRERGEQAALRLVGVRYIAKGRRAMASSALSTKRAKGMKF